MARKRFNKAEKELIAATGVRGHIEWQNVTQWHKGYLLSLEIETDPWGWQTVAVYNQDDTRTVGTGPIPVGPGHIRRPPTNAEVLAAAAQRAEHRAAGPEHAEWCAGPGTHRPMSPPEQAARFGGGAQTMGRTPLPPRSR